MTRRKSANRVKARRPTEATPKPPNVLQSNKSLNVDRAIELDQEGELMNIKSLLIEDAIDPKPGTSNSNDSDLTTTSLHHELDSFRQRWKRELEFKNSVSDRVQTESAADNNLENTEKENHKKTQNLTSKEFYESISNPPSNPQDVYALAKKLFLAGAELEQDEMHHESIRYYKQAMHLYPDIERQIFREQCEASLESCKEEAKVEHPQSCTAQSGSDMEQAEPLYERIVTALRDNLDERGFTYCRPSRRKDTGNRHISDMPHDIILRIFRHVIGQELDLASLEVLGLVCRGFFLLSRDTSLWRSICFRTWGDKVVPTLKQIKMMNIIDWRQIYLERPRVNCDGVYISRTKYIRQGDVGFQDITYRPFHVIRYYRYLRFFPDKRVLILTTNEEPERIIPIFRNALHARHFSPELSVLEGSYDFIDTNLLTIVAEKDFTQEREPNQHPSHIQKRQAILQWSRQTPLWQKFDYKFELKTLQNRPYRNNILKWAEYGITSRFETGEEITTFDLSPDSFPNLSFSRVKSFNLRQTEPLASH